MAKETLNLTLDKDVKNALKEYAEKNYMSVSAVITMWAMWVLDDLKNLNEVKK